MRAGNPTEVPPNLGQPTFFWLQQPWHAYCLKSSKANFPCKALMLSMYLTKNTGYPPHLWESLPSSDLPPLTATAFSLL